MVKILGINSKIIVTILYVYYWETGADGDRGELDIWEPNPIFDFRRAQTTKKVTPDVKSRKASLRTKEHDVAKFTEGYESEISHNAPKDIPKNVQPHIESIEMRHKYDPDDDEYDANDKTIDKSNTKENHSVDKTHNKMDKKHYTDKTHTVDHRGTVTDQFDDENKHKKIKSHKGQGITIKNLKVGREKGNDEDMDDYNHFSYVQKHHSNNKRMSAEEHFNNDKYSSNEKEIDSKNEKDQNNEKHHKNDKTQTNDKHQNIIKHHTVDKHVTIDKYLSNDKHNIAKHLSTNKPQNHNNIKQHNYYDTENKNIHFKDKNHLREKMHSKDGDIQAKATKAREPKFPIRQHRTKLRTHNDHLALRSTRMTPMYLMQQPPEEKEKDAKTSTAQPENTPSYLSPYSLASQMKRIMEEFTDVNVTIDILDRTVEYNDLVLVKMTESKNENGKFFRAAESKYMDEVPEKKIIFIVHGLSVMGINDLPALVHEPSLKILISYYIAHLKFFDIFLMPMANPDGYSAANVKGIWNKNMSPQEACPGVALDRNFDVAWNSSRKLSSCSQLFPGKAAFSETESKAIKDVFHYHGHKILAYIHVHAGTYTDLVFKGDAILYPRGFSESQSDDDKYIDLKGEIDEAMKNASFQVLSVTVDTLYNWYGKVSGSSVDYAATVYGIPYALEFVMQLYSDEGEVSHMDNALKEVWSRLINTSFKNMYKSLRSNEIQRK